MSTKNLAREVESIALALSEEGGYEYYHIDDDLKELAKNVSDMQAENAKLRELALELWAYAEQELVCDENCPYGDTCDWMEPTVVCVFRRRMRELGVEVD